jgi:sarcosine oxidase, subunit beta
MIGSHFGTEVKVRLALKAMETWKNFNDVYGAKGEYYGRCGRVWLVPEDDADAMRGIVEMQRGFGSDARILTNEELHERAPQVFLDDVAGIVHEPSAGFADALGATSAVAQSARDAGVEIRLGVAACAIKVAGGKATGVERTTGAISAPMVFNAAYLGAAPLLEPLGVKIPVRAARAQIALFRRPLDYGPRPPAIADFVQGNYMRDHPGKIMFVGGMERPSPMPTTIPRPPTGSRCRPSASARIIASP